METVEIVRVRFLWPGKMYEFRNPHKLPLKKLDKVVVETLNGGSMVGSVSVAPRIRIRRDEDRQLSPVLRLATPQDLSLETVTDPFRRDVKNFFDQRIRSREASGVRLVDIEKADGGRRLIVYILNENRRFDHRDVQIEMGHKFGVRVDMRSVGIRDAARLAGGIGRCGLSMCCSTWLPDFAQVSIRMAKDQGLSLEPDSISGQCGRLLCCLGYEHENYVAMGKGLPKVGKTVISPAGEGRVVKLDVLQGLVTIRTTEGVYEMFPADQVKRKFGPGGPGGGGRGRGGQNSEDADDHDDDEGPLPEPQ